MGMKIFFSLLILSLAAGALPAQDNSLIEWRADKKLKWNDFKADPDPSSPNAALTTSIIRYDFAYSDAQGFIFHIHCQFNKNASWGRTKTDYILSHEQGHFDITEIYARRLNKAFKEYKAGADIKKEVNKIYKDTMHDLGERQNQYDQETNFSIKHPEQEQWLKKISEELKELEPFASYD
jgi:hypothetical protein